MYRSIITVYDRMEQDMQSVVNYLRSEIPGITDDEIKYFCNNYGDSAFHIALRLFKSKLKFKKWNQSKHKHYYRVKTCRGYHKIVYMCEEMVQHLYGSNYIKV